ncbi:hypothetical protein AAD001_01770 [Colwelliaceae bacterium 6471]
MRNVFLMSFVILLVGCSTTGESLNQSNWDFDHEVQYKQTQIDENKYHIEVVATSKTRFSTLATFLIRRSLDVCQRYGFKIEVLEGVESFNDKLGLPNLIMGSLAANVECPSNND